MMHPVRRVLEWISTRNPPDEDIERREVELLESRARTTQEVASGLRNIGMRDEAREREEEVRRLRRMIDEYMRGMGAPDE